MGTYFKNIECTVIFKSEAALKTAFNLVEEEIDDVFSIEDFVRVGPAYAFMKREWSMPYTMAEGVEAFLRELVANSLFGQYFLENEELGIDSTFTKDMPEGLNLIEFSQSIQNSPGFSEYFEQDAVYKMYDDGYSPFQINVEKVQIEGKEYFYYDFPEDEGPFPWPLTYALFQIEENAIYIVMAPYDSNMIVKSGNFSHTTSLREVFATDDPALDREAFVLSEENGFFYHKFEFITQAELRISEQLFEDCLLLRTRYVHGNCFDYKEENKRMLDHYVCDSPDLYTYWQKGRGLVAFKTKSGEGEWSEFVCIERGEEPLSKPERTFVEEEIEHEKREDNEGVEETKGAESEESKSGKKKPGFWKRLFGG